MLTFIFSINSPSLLNPKTINGKLLQVEVISANTYCFSWLTSWLHTAFTASKLYERDNSLMSSKQYDTSMPGM